jgi:hypothetical protein
VLPASRPLDDNFVGPLDKTAGVPPQTRPADWRAVEDLLGLLARAIQQLHTYPATSPMCIGAIESCQRALALLDHRDGLAFRVTPSELIVDDVPTGRGTQIEHELARRLHRASVSSVSIDRAATARELGRFCGDLVTCGERAAGDATLLDLLTEHGVDRIALEMGRRPEVLDVGAAPAGTTDDLARERARFDARVAKGGVVNYLYPPQKGWVRLDPASGVPSVSLVELAVLIEDPSALASMLLRLTDDAPDGSTPGAALEKKYSDVAMLFSALDPRLARRMFGRLARAVLDLDPGSRQSLLRRTILPGLLDGRVDGAILHDFPDVDLAESLCLLLDLETAAPELLTTALARLDLSAERHAAMVPLLEERLAHREQAESGRQTTLARHARELVRVDGSAEKSFAEFAAFDLSLDADAVATLAGIRSAVAATDLTLDRLRCVWHLTCLEPNPDMVRRFLDQGFARLDELERASRHGELAPWLAGYRDLAARVRETRPDVADVIVAKLAWYCTPERAAWIVDLSMRDDEGRRTAGAVVEALGTAVAAPLVDLLERAESGRSAQARSRAAAQLMADHAAQLSPALAPLVGASPFAVRRTLVRVLGLAGPGYEQPIASQIDGGDELTAREALRSLARIGTPQAGAFVISEIVKQRGALGGAAEESLWHFPAATAQRCARELLGRREFTLKHPQVVERLLDRAARTGTAGLEPVLRELAPLRFRIWNPALARTARKAHAMLNR